MLRQQPPTTMPLHSIPHRNSRDILPFLKWAGGKRWLIDRHPSLFPISYARYIEPFVGSGAVFFFLRPRIAILGDSNRDLIETYSAIKEDWEKVAFELVRHQRNHGHRYYYLVRESKPRTASKRAARFIYLNRTCWNGLYRVNRQGKFNVPIGTKDSVILPTDDFQSVSQLLQDCDLLITDFETLIDNATGGDFIFADPPYTTKHNVNGFIKYNERLFSWDDQLRLYAALARARGRGASILLTNANHRSIRNLYDVGFTIETAKRFSVIAGDNAARRECTELIIRG